MPSSAKVILNAVKDPSRMRAARSRGRFFVSLRMTIVVILIAQPASALTPNDPNVTEQWYLEKITASAAWDATTGSSEVVVAVLDTGVDLDHPDIAANLWMNAREVQDGRDNDGNGYSDDIRGWNFVEENNIPEPPAAGGYTRAGLVHGTLVAGIIGAVGNNRAGIAGINWTVKIMPLRVLNNRGDGATADIVQGIDYAVRNGADIVNLSFTTFDPPGALTEAIRRAKDAGVLVVAAAGNNGSQNLDTTTIYPVCIDGGAGENWVLGVASVNRSDQRSVFSNYGSLCVDLSAPGEEIFGTEPIDPRVGTSGYSGGWSGTSVAAPIVTGAAALVRAAAPRLSRTELIDVLKRTATPIDSLNPLYRGMLGRGRIDLAAAVARARTLESAAVRQRIAVSGDGGSSSRVWIFDTSGTLVSVFYAYAPTFTGGVRLAAGDVDGDGIPEIVTGAGPGGGPHVRIFDESGVVKGQFFAFGSGFRGGITVAVGDIDGDRRAEIIVGAGRGGGPTVKIFDGAGVLKGQFLAYTSAFTGGVEVATGDTDGDGTLEIVTGAGPGGGPHVRIFDRQGRVMGQFFAFDATYTGGVRLGTGDVDGDRKADIVAVRGSVDASEVKIFSGTGALRTTFAAFVPTRRTVLGVTTMNRDSTSRAEAILAAPGVDAGVRGFSSVGALVLSFGLPAELTGALRLATF